MGFKIDIIGNTYGKLTVISFKGNNKHRQSLWECLCACGHTVTVAGNNLNSGITSCRYCKTPKMLHGKAHEPTYNVWANMIQRCTNPNNPAYLYYGGRGILVCSRWLKFKNFLYDMGEKPFNLTLDRIDNNKSYYKDNCRWATRKEQANNTSPKIRIQIT